MSHYILAVNPGSTSTKIGLYCDEQQLMKKSIEHSSAELSPFDSVYDQLDFRYSLVLDTLREYGFDVSRLDCVVGRGGMLPPICPGGYAVNQEMINELLHTKNALHASNLGCMIAKKIAEPLGIPAYIYDGVSAANLLPHAKITGLPETPRQSFCHVLNARAVSIQYAQQQGKSYQDIRVIVAHLGGGITFSAHANGKIIDSVADDDGAFSPERTGGIPLIQVVNLCFSGKYTREQILKKIRGLGGLRAHLGTTDCRDIEKMIERGDAHAKLIYEAQALQIAKGIGVMAAAMKGNIEAILLTGGLAHSQMLTQMVREYVEFIAPVRIFPGENELEALSQGALRILRGEEQARSYPEQNADACC